MQSPSGQMLSPICRMRLPNRKSGPQFGICCHKFANCGSQIRWDGPKMRIPPPKTPYRVPKILTSSQKRQVGIPKSKIGDKNLPLGRRTADYGHKIGNEDQETRNSDKTIGLGTISINRTPNFTNWGLEKLTRWKNMPMAAKSWLRNQKSRSEDK